jgi:hypothetical protein
MSVEQEDLVLLKQCRQLSPEGNSCAILGNCRFAMGLETFKTEMNFDIVETLDINGSPTHRVNLNEPINDETLFGKYDWVIDSGTLYCCFDVSTSLRNMLYILKDRGCVSHTSNLSGFFGRGFYSLSPALFRDFFNVNGFEIQVMASKTRQSLHWQRFNASNTYLLNADLDFQEYSGDYIPSISNDAMIYCFARRNSRTEFTKPIPQHFVDTDGA